MTIWPINQAVSFVTMEHATWYSCSPFKGCCFKQENPQLCPNKLGFFLSILGFQFSYFYPQVVTCRSPVRHRDVTERLSQEASLRVSAVFSRLVEMDHDNLIRIHLLTQRLVSFFLSWAYWRFWFLNDDAKFPHSVRPVCHS